MVGNPLSSGEGTEGGRRGIGEVELAGGVVLVLLLLLEAAAVEEDDVDNVVVVVVEMQCSEVAAEGPPSRIVLAVEPENDNVEGAADPSARSARIVPHCATVLRSGRSLPSLCLSDNLCQALSQLRLVCREVLREHELLTIEETGQLLLLRPDVCLLLVCLKLIVDSGCKVCCPLPCHISHQLLLLTWFLLCIEPPCASILHWPLQSRGGAIVIHDELLGSSIRGEDQVCLGRIHEA
mmetsp:Transcript_2100/g.4428  ORF Transcript_2100/g.4428 Transcript_2100/m.4428 type:complete len:237 (-) Transcript_2100:511-1221(-)